MEIRTLLFDLDDTLVVDEAVSRDALKAVAEHAFSAFGVDRESFVLAAKEHAAGLWRNSPVHPYCRRIGISAFECLWGRFDGDSDDISALREWAHPFRRQVMDAALRQQAIEDGEAAEVLAVSFESNRRALQRLMPNARETLTVLKPVYRIGLLTNGAPDLQREKLAASGLDPFFDAVAISGEQNIGKPQKAIFQYLLGELGAEAGHAVMIGNSMERDIAGARNAGIRSIWIRVKGSEEPDDVVPDATIDGLAELPELLKKMEKTAASI